MNEIQSFISQFDIIDGRPLWKYDLSDDQFLQLKEHLSNINPNEVDPCDITLYYAEYWKNIYNGGHPTKEDVYQSLGKCALSSEDFYKSAKEGAVLLGIRWIQRENTLYFRTLLMQGGLPLNHLIKHHGVYTTFLKKVLEINPVSVADFDFDEDIVRYLPHSSRNEAIYESCLQIVQAIWNGNTEYLAIFENKPAFKKIADELKEYKTTLEKNVRRIFKFRAYWILNAQTGEIRLVFNLPDVIESGDLADFLGTNSANLKSKYQLVVNDKLVYSFARNVAGNFKVLPYNNSPVVWDGQETKPSIYLSDNDTGKYNLPINLVDYPKISEPTLWTQKNDDEWILNKGTHCSQDKAAILFNSEWNFPTGCIVSNKNIKGQQLNWLEFEREIRVEKEGECVVFNTGANAFDWVIQEHKPSWVLKSNIPIVENNPSIIVYDQSGQKISKVELRWRFYGDMNWKKWGDTMPQGCIEYKIVAGGCEERNCFYNIGSLRLNFDSNNLNQAEIEVTNKQALDFDIKPDANLAIETKGNTYRLTLGNSQQMPKSIGVVVKKNGQSRGLHLEIIPPFRGVRVSDPDGNLLANGAELLFGSLMGYRIYTTSQFHNYYVKIYNTDNSQIKIIKKLPKSITPLREYEEIAMRLFRLTDSMDRNSSVSIEFSDEQAILCSFKIKNYNKNIEKHFVDNQLQINLNDGSTDTDLFAIPLDCAAENINLVLLSKLEGNYIFPEDTFFLLDKFIVFSALNDNSKLLPGFVSRNSEAIPTTPDDKIRRINDIISRLQDEDIEGNQWKSLIKYYKICLNHGIPFSTFDVFRTSASTPELAAKLFCTLFIYNEDADFIDRICKDLENDLGFCFHWISKAHWEGALSWVKTGPLGLTNADVELINQNIATLIKSSESLDWFDKIAACILKNGQYPVAYHYATETRTVRQSLGERVLQELPTVCPSIQDNFSQILPVNADTYPIKILLKAPLAVALSMSGRDESIWNTSVTIRRNVQYCQPLAPDWYGKSILYCLNQLR